MEMKFSKSFIKFLVKFYSTNQLGKEGFQDWRGRLKKVTNEEELNGLLKEIGTKENADSLLELYEDVKAEEEAIEKETGEKTLTNEIREIRGAVLLQLTIKNRNNATEIIVKEFMKDNYVYTTMDDIKPEMWIYKEGVYLPEGRTFVKQFCRTILGEAYTGHLANTVIGKIEADTGIDADEFFKQEHTYEVPVGNGILNIKTKELSEFTPKKIFFNKLPVEFDPDAECPMIDQFLSDVLASPDDKKVYYELAGFGLLKDYKFEKALMLIGDGRNGKSKSLELLKRLVGVENCCSIPLGSLTASNFSLSELFGKLFNLAGDLSSRDLKYTGTFKGLTGRDTITAPRKFLRDLIFTNYAKMVFACNELPRVYDSSMAFWARWVLLEFPYTFVDQETYDALGENKENFKLMDTDIINKITTPEEISGFLNQALKGLDRLLKNKSFSYSIGTKEVKDKWIRKSDSFLAFCLDNVKENYSSKVSKQKMRNLYSKYCKTHKLRGCSDLAIKITLQENYGVTEEFTSEFGVGGQKWCWVGVEIKC